MSLTLGLDLGTNSIGWALIDEDAEKVFNLGSYIFQEGVNRDTRGNEVSKNEARRNARQIRRQYFRKKLRRKMVIEYLLNKNFITEDISNRLLNNNYKANQNSSDWFKLNPYQIRAKALTQEITKEEFSRIIYHIAKLRGFKSSRKGQAKDTKIDKTDPKSNRVGINDTQKQIDEGHLTVGNYLYSIYPEENKPFKNINERIRNRVLSRAMLLDELDKIWEVQSEFSPTVYNNEIKNELLDPRKGILFFQRELKSQKALVGKCKFEQNKPVSPISTFYFEEFRTYQFLNNIDYDENKILTPEQKISAFNFLSSKDKKITFPDLVKYLKLSEHSFNYDENTPVAINKTHFIFNKLYPEKIQDEWTCEELENKKENFWQIFSFAKDQDWLNKYAREKWNFNDKQIEILEKSSLKDGYSSLSKKAIMNILPFLKEGYKYNIAVVLGGVKNAFGDSDWQFLASEDREYIIETIENICNSYNKEGELINKICNFLSDTYGLGKSDLKKLYHHSQSTEQIKIMDALPVPPNLRNPIVNKALLALRKLINNIIKQYGKVDEIKIEMARDLKLPKKKRDEIRIKNFKNEKANKEASEYLKTQGLKDSRDNLQKYLLYKEIEIRHGNVISPYSGKSITLDDVFSENNIIQIEHIIPYSVSLDDSFANKTLCETEINDAKGDKTPYQYFGSDSEEWEKIKERAFEVFLYPKAKRFVSENQPTLDYFIQRQLNDTRYISKAAKDYLKQICPKVTVSTGKLTSTLRHLWGLNNILNPEDNEKNRYDHRHHAIDAVTIACTKTSYLQALSTYFANSRTYTKFHRPKYRLPWEHFFEDVKDKAENILISFDFKPKLITKVSKKIHKKGKIYRSVGLAARGELHGQTYYGKRLDKDINEYFYHSRKSLENITKISQIGKIASSSIREIIYNRLRELNIDLNANKKDIEIPNNAFFKVNADGSKEPLLFLPNKRGEKVPIKKVRLKENKTKIFKLHKDLNQWVETSGNHHTSIYVGENGKYYEETVSFRDAVKRRLNHKPVINKKSIITDDGVHADFLVSMQINEMFLIGLKPSEIDNIDWNNPDKRFISEHLYRVQKLSTEDYSFMKHTVAKVNKNDDEDVADEKKKKNEKDKVIRIRSLKKFKELNPTKVKVDYFGNISLK